MGRPNKKIRTDKQACRHLPEEIIEEILHLPEEIIEEILPRLQVKSLLRFQLVSKSWASLIGSERFIKAHLQNSRENADLGNHRAIYDYLPDLVHPSSEGEINELKQYSVHSLMNDPVPDPSGLEHLTEFGVVGCCNGLVCVRDPTKMSFYLWNPATRIWIELPKLEGEVFLNRNGIGYYEGFVNRTGFGWDESSGAYKVFVFLCNGTIDDLGFDRCIVYSSNTNKWERVETDFDWGIFCAREEGVLVNGKLHWHGYGGSDVEIVSLDLKSAVIETMDSSSIEEEGRYLFNHCVSLGVVWGCLSEVQHRRRRKEIGVWVKELDREIGVWVKELDVWVMKEYGVKESWYRAFSVVLDDFIGRGLYYRPYVFKPFSEIANLLGEGPDGEILISYECFFLAYHPKKYTMTVVSRLNEIKPGARAHIYFETLLSPEKIQGPNATLKNRLAPNATLKNRFLRFLYFCVGRLL